MTAKPLVSVLIPVFNGQPFIAQAIESVMRQTYRNFELIVVDDGSTDQSLSMVPVHEKIKIVRQKNRGISAALTTAVTNAHGDLIAFLDQDDLYYPDKLALQVDFLLSRPDIIMHVVSADFIDESGKEIGRPAEPYLFCSLRTQLQALFLKNIIPSFSYAMVRRRFLEAAGGISVVPYRYIVDYDLWLRLASMGPFHLSAVPLVAKRFHGGNFSAGREQAIREIIDCLGRSMKSHSEIRSLGKEKLTERFDALMVELYEYRRRNRSWDIADDVCLPVQSRRSERIALYYRSLFDWLGNRRRPASIGADIRAEANSRRSPALHFLLGLLQNDQQEPDMACASFAKAQILAAGRFPEALHNGLVLSSVNLSISELQAQLAAVVRLAPNYRDARQNLHRIGSAQAPILTYNPFNLQNRLFLF